MHRSLVGAGFLYFVKSTSHMKNNYRKEYLMTTKKGPKPITRKAYKKQFKKDLTKRKRAFEIALDTRKYEIELYWKRATYFWTFIAASLGGFGAIQASSSANKTDLSVFLSCLGFVFSFGWFCVNRGSKYWQENWENHIELLEDEECGPLYKTVLSRPKPSGFIEVAQHWINGPSSISVSKVNQIISLYVTLLWGFLIFYSLPPFNFDHDINSNYVIVISMSIIACILFKFSFGKTYIGDHHPKATQRSIKIEK